MGYDRATFTKLFRLLTGNDPFPWQQALYRRIVAGEFPSSCSLPTGLGKTSVIAIWLLALASQGDIESGKRVPRRLAYVVNRRTIVDQATREAEKLRLALAKPELAIVRNRLAALWGGQGGSNNDGENDPPLAISTLRGQFADNGEWSADPARPAIIVGTVDMIGSRLLFSGYGRGFKHRPLHAGFLGQDTLLVHDEAHLEPAFQELLESLKLEQTRCREFRPFHVLPLTATPRGEGQGSVFALTDEDHEHSIIKRRLEAQKTIVLHPREDEKKAADVIASLAVDRARAVPGAAILIFVRRVDDVKKIVGALAKAKIPGEKTMQLTGTLRGLERDALVKTPLFQRCMPSSGRESGVVPESGTVFLVCTSAGEVGVDISADHLVCDLTPFDSMAQRFGRVNRYGDGNAQIDVVHPAKFDGPDKYDIRRQDTLALLRRLGGDGSPKAIGDLPIADRIAAFTPTPKVLAATDILFDAWSMTTIREVLPGRPPVADWLHGVPEEWQPSETQVAWREEVDVITGGLLAAHKSDLPEWLDDYPLKPQEILRDRTDRVFAELEQLAENATTEHFWIINEDGVEVRLLRDVIGGDSKRIKESLEDCIVLLPPSIGGLQRGMLAGSAAAEIGMQYDVSDKWFEDTEGMRKRRVRVWDDERPPAGMRLVRTIDTRPDGEDDASDDPGDDVAIATPVRRFWKWYTLPRWADDDGSRAGLQRVELQAHNDNVKQNVQRMVAALGLGETVEGKTLVLAAAWHDLGKDRQVWQRSIRNDDYPSVILAKSGNRLPPIDLGAYRHEFGSMLDALSPKLAKEWSDLADEQRELVLHFIAAHHGRARPHFPADEGLDPERSSQLAEETAREVPRRFARLQRKYGRWGLAYLESILRAADGEASANPSKTLNEETQEPTVAQAAEVSA